MTPERRRLTPATARQLTQSTEPWLACADRPEMDAHLSGCAACAEETRSLLLLVADQDRLEPGPATRRLR